jgi:RNA polymerase sigma factor (sigma-70 family)
MSNSAEVATAGEGDSTPSPLSDDQLAAFWSSILSHQEHARATARRLVSRQTVDDVVNTAALLFLESFQRRRKPAKYPQTDQAFGRQYLAIVRNHAIDCIRDSASAKRPVHSHWGKETEPIVGGRKIANRALDRVFARNDAGDYDAPAPALARDKDDLDTLDQILRHHLATLPRMQRQVLTETFLEKRKRAEVARRLGISVHTYDNHLQAGFSALRRLLSQDADTYTEVDRTVWYDLVEELRELYDASRVRRVPRKTRDLSAPAGDRSSSASDRSNSAGDRGKSARHDAA